MKTYIAHQMMSRAVRSGYKRFCQQTDQLEKVQRTKLTQLLNAVSAVNPRLSANWSWEDFAQQCPVTDYDDWREGIEKQRLGELPLIDSPVSRYQPTSGSTSKFKLIPYTKLFLDELDQAIMPWFGSLYETNSALKQGKQYWSLSWLPESRRDLMSGDVNDDSKLLSAGKRILSNLTQTVPQGVSLAHTVDDAMFATLVYLLAEKSLSLISVWSPTFALTLFDELNDAQTRQQVIETFKQRQWPTSRQASLSHLNVPKRSDVIAILENWQDGSVQEFQTIWPQLAMISSWDTAMSSQWANELKSRFPHSSFQGKGLWMTEGVVTIPWQDHYILAYQSHFYEFECVETGNIMPSWDLKKGMEVVPIISTGSGFLRYKTSDLVKVTGFVGKVPTIEFMGRLNGVDMVGEKLSPTIAQEMLNGMVERFPDIVPVSVLALDDNVQDSPLEKPRYVALIKQKERNNVKSPEQIADIAAFAEQHLQRNFHYELARNLQQLDPVAVYCKDDAHQQYVNLCLGNDMIEGDIKFEPLKYCNNKQIIHSIVAEAVS